MFFCWYPYLRLRIPLPRSWPLLLLFDHLELSHWVTPDRRVPRKKEKFNAKMQNLTISNFFGAPEFWCKIWSCNFLKRWRFPFARGITMSTKNCNSKFCTKTKFGSSKKIRNRQILHFWYEIYIWYPSMVEYPSHCCRWDQYVTRTLQPQAPQYSAFTKTISTKFNSKSCFNLLF